ncbi:MAG TPA: hotdog fold thioesterase [Prolixibacteraceae bacterium]|nr:hotdog fold thioesterase [Prolixibacteraceae bacterium]
MKSISLDEINRFCENSMVGHLGIRFTGFTSDTLQATMPVHTPTHQPMGYLHGGASLALAETVASAGSLLRIDSDVYDVFGMQVSGNHLAPIREGTVVATASLLHQGKRTHVWDVEIRDEGGKLISAARVTMAIVEKKK